MASRAAQSSLVGNTEAWATAWASSVFPHQYFGAEAPHIEGNTNGHHRSIIHHHSSHLNPSLALPRDLRCTTNNHTPQAIKLPGIRLQRRLLMPKPWAWIHQDLRSNQRGSPVGSVITIATSQ